jgi:hypothetical protein
MTAWAWRARYCAENRRRTAAARGRYVVEAWWCAVLALLRAVTR